MLSVVFIQVEGWVGKHRIDRLGFDLGQDIHTVGLVKFSETRRQDWLHRIGNRPFFEVPHQATRSTLRSLRPSSPWTTYRIWSMVSASRMLWRPLNSFTYRCRCLGDILW